MKVSDGASLTGKATGSWTAGATTTLNTSGTATVDANGNTVNVSAAAGTNGWTITNGGGAATITGSNQNNTITGGTGNDTLNGGNGVDTLTGGTGADALNGGGGNDVYRYAATTDGSTTPGSGDTIATGNFNTAADAFNFVNAAFGNLGTGALTAAADTAFDTDQATTLTNLAAKADSEVYRATFTGSTFNAAFYDALDAAMTGGTHTGAAFFIITNGTDSRILFDADTNATAAGSIVELVKITGAATLTVATTDLVII